MGPQTDSVVSTTETRNQDDWKLPPQLAKVLENICMKGYDPLDNVEGIRMFSDK